MTLRVLIADDEPLARQNLRALLSSDRCVEIVGECEDGPSTASRLLRGGVDLLFLDVEMPGENGLEVVRAVGDGMPAVIFVTAFDSYTLAAFDAEAIDYLLKPFDDERFQRALARAKRRLATDAAAAVARGFDALLGHRRRLALRTARQTEYVDVAQIDWIEADDYCVIVHTAGRSIRVRDSLQTMVTRLDADRFLRIHRSAIVQVARVAAIERVKRGHYRAVLIDGTAVPIGRSQRAELERRLATDS